MQKKTGQCRKKVGDQWTTIESESDIDCLARKGGSIPWIETPFEDAEKLMSCRPYVQPYGQVGEPAIQLFDTDQSGGKCSDRRIEIYPSSSPALITPIKKAVNRINFGDARWPDLAPKQVDAIIVPPNQSITMFGGNPDMSLFNSIRSTKGPLTREKAKTYIENVQLYSRYIPNLNDILKPLVFGVTQALTPAKGESSPPKEDSVFTNWQYSGYESVLEKVKAALDNVPKDVPLYNSSQERTFGPGIHANLDLPGGKVQRNQLAYILETERKEPLLDFKLKCCTGEKDPLLCGSLGSPYGTACRNLMKQQCSDPKWFFDEIKEQLVSCKKWVANIPDEERNTFALKMCTSSTLNPFQAEWCSCYVPRNLPSQLAGKGDVKKLWHCMDEACNERGFFGKGLSIQPFQKPSCPAALDICKNFDIDDARENSDVIQAFCEEVLPRDSTFLSDWDKEREVRKKAKAEKEAATRKRNWIIFLVVGLIVAVAAILYLMRNR